MTTRINHLAVWILVIADQLIGALWYSQYLFGDAWLGYHGKIMTDITNPTNPTPFVVSIVAAIVTNYALAWIVGKLQAFNAVAGLKVALVCWFAFLFVSYATIEAFSAFGRNPATIIAINMGYTLLVFAVGGLVLGAWRRGAIASAG